MKAILMTATGNPDVLKPSNITEPEITHASEVKVRIHAAGVNPIDTKLRRNGLFYNNALPAVLGCDGAGRVIATGDAVSRFKVGDKVWFCHGGLGLEQGNYAEFNVLDERWISLMPASLSYSQAAAAPLVCITASGALFDRGGLQAGQTVLIHGGAGGVGHVAIQLAKIMGARVITTVGNAQKAAFVQSLGADESIIYPEQDFAEAVKDLTHGKGVDLVLDTVGAEVFKTSIAITAHFGRIVTLLDPGELCLKEARMRNLLIGFELMLTPMLRNLPEARDKQVEILKRCAKWVDNDLLKIELSHVMALDDAALAHQQIETGHTSGKIVLSI
ncbi:zinc-dependent alcohol dehydrogenase family protein [Methylosoma difficile]